MSEELAQVDSQALIEITRNVVCDFLGLEATLRRVEETIVLPRIAGVIITGAWNGRVNLYCHDGLSRQFASAMFGRDGSQVEPSETQDALNELANIIGGNLKATLPGPSDLSLPLEPIYIDGTPAVGVHIEVAAGQDGILCVSVMPDDIDFSAFNART